MDRAWQGSTPSPALRGPTSCYLRRGHGTTRDACLVLGHDVGIPADTSGGQTSLHERTVTCAHLWIGSLAHSRSEETQRIASDPRVLHVSPAVHHRSNGRDIASRGMGGPDRAGLDGDVDEVAAACAQDVGFSACDEIGCRNF